MLSVRILYNFIKLNKWKVICMTIVVVAAWLVWYNWMAIYVVYAVKESGWEPVYRSMFLDRAKEKYFYMNGHKEEDVKHYILMDEEMGNSIVPI